MQICIERTDENAIFDALLCYRTRDIRSSGEAEKILPQIIDDFPAVWNYRSEVVC